MSQVVKNNRGFLQLLAVCPAHQRQFLLQTASPHFGIETVLIVFYSHKSFRETREKIWPITFKNIFNKNSLWQSSGFWSTEDFGQFPVAVPSVPPVPGGYTEWSQWEKCSVTCGGGVQSRYRTCTSPPPSDGGLTCIEQNLGPAEEIRQCNQQNCRKCYFCPRVTVSCYRKMVKIVSEWTLLTGELLNGLNNEKIYRMVIKFPPTTTDLPDDL